MYIQLFIFYTSSPALAIFPFKMIILNRCEAISHRFDFSYLGTGHAVHFFSCACCDVCVLAKNVYLGPLHILKSDCLFSCYGFPPSHFRKLTWFCSYHTCCILFINYALLEKFMKITMKDRDIEISWHHVATAAKKMYEESTHFNSILDFLTKFCRKLETLH